MMVEFAGINLLLTTQLLNEMPKYFSFDDKEGPQSI